LGIPIGKIPKFQTELAKLKKGGASQENVKEILEQFEKQTSLLNEKKLQIEVLELKLEALSIDYSKLKVEANELKLLSPSLPPQKVTEKKLMERTCVYMLQNQVQKLLVPRAQFLVAHKNSLR